MIIIRRLIDKIENTYHLYLTTILISVLLIAYSASLFNGFVWDDEEQIINNTIIQNVSNIPFLFTSSTFNTGGAGLSGFYYKPLMPIAFSINYFFWKNNAFGFHLFDLSIHILNSILVFTFFKKIFSLQKIPYSKTIAFTLSLIFAVHPANTESVAYVSSTQELLAAFFLILALLLTLKFLAEKQKTSVITILFLNIFILLSLLSKESGVIAIPLIFILSFLYARNKIILAVLSSSVTFTIYLFLRFAVAKTPIFQHNSIIPIANASLLNRLTTIPFEIFSYFRLLFFPADLSVAQHTVVKNIFDPRFYVNLPVVIILLIFLTYVFIKNYSKMLLFFTTWVIFSFFILLNIYPLDMTIAERWLYIPMIGILGIIGIAIGNLFKMNKKNTALLCIGIIFILIPIFSIKTITRSLDWKNNFTLFSHDEKYSKESFDLQNNLGVAFFRNGDIKNAKIHFEKSINLSPKWWTPYNNLGVICQHEGNLKKAKLLYQKSIDSGNYYLAYENLAGILYQTEKPEDALIFTKSALDRLPNNETLNKIASFLHYKLNATDSAKFHAQKTYQINQSRQNYLFLQSILNTIDNKAAADELRRMIR